MTRETKVGLVVAGSFLCLVGVVVASRLGRHAETTPPDTTPQAAAVKQEAAPAAKKEPDNKIPGSKKMPSEIVLANAKSTTVTPQGKAAEPGTFPFPSAQAIQPPPLFPSPSAPAAHLDENAKKKSLADEAEQDKATHELIKKNKAQEAANQAATKIPGKPDDGLPPALPLGTSDGIPAPIAAKQKAAQPPAAASPIASGGPIKEPAKAETVKPAPLETAAPVAIVNPAALSGSKDPLPPPPNLGQAASPIPLPVAPPTLSKQESPAPVAPLADSKPKNLPPIPPVNPAPPPAQIALNKELTNPNLPPLGSEIKNPTPPVVVPTASVKPASGSAPKVIDFNVESYECTADDTSFEAVSTRKFGSPKYAKALLQYNRLYFVAKDNILQQDNPRLLPRQIVFIPPQQFLEDRFVSLIDNRPATPSPPSNPAVTITAPVNSKPVSRAPTPVPTSDATKSYRVAGQGQMLIEIAQQTLGDRGRWSEIYRLNPSVRPEYPIPGGTEIRLPANATVP